MYQKVMGLAVRSTDYKEADKILTVITAEMGKITVKAPGALRKGSKTAAACRLFAFSSMTLYEKSGRFTLKEADVEEVFDGLSKSLENMAAASYISEVLAGEEYQNTAEPEVLALALNSLYALSKELYPPLHIKAVFELRYASLLGYTPDLWTCAACAEPMDMGYFIPGEGLAHCKNCGRAGLKMDKATLSAAQHILTAPIKNIFSFTLKEEARLFEMAEKHLLLCLDRGFRTLDFLKEVMI